MRVGRPRREWRGPREQRADRRTGRPADGERDRDAGRRSAGDEQPPAAEQHQRHCGGRTQVERPFRGEQRERGHDGEQAHKRYCRLRGGFARGQAWEAVRQAVGEARPHLKTDDDRDRHEERNEKEAR